MTGIEDKKQVGNAQAISTLNKYFTTSGLSSVSDEEFGKAMQDSAGRQAIYDILVKRGLDVGDYDKFSTDFGFGIVTPEPEEVVVEPEVTSAPEQVVSQTGQTVTEVTTEPEDESWRLAYNQQLAAIQQRLGAGKQAVSGMKLEAPRKLSESIVEQQKAMSNPTNVMRMVGANPEYYEQQQLFNNIKTGNIGDKEYAYLNEQRDNALAQLSEYRTSVKKYMDSLPEKELYWTNFEGQIQLTEKGQELVSILDYIGAAEKQYKSLVTKEDYKRNGGKAGFWAGFSNFDLGNTLSLGYGKKNNQATLAKIIQKHERGEQLTDYEQLAINAFGTVGNLEMAVNGLGGATTGYTMSKGFVDTLPFMASMALTGGISNAAGKGAATFLLGKNAGKLVAGAGRMFATGTTSFALSPQFGAANTYDSMISEFEQFGALSDTPMWKRFAKGYGQSYAEFLSEASGGILTSYIKGVTPEIGFKRWLRTKFKLTDNESITKFLEHMQWSGALEEFEEEMFNNLIQPLFTGENALKSWEESFSLENIKTTAGTVLLTSVAMGAPVVAIQGGSAIHWRSKANTALKNIENPNLRQTLYDAVRLESTEDVQRALAAIDWRNQDISDIQNAAEYVNYHTYAYVAEGAEMSEVAKKEMSGKIAIIEGVAHEGMVRTAEYEGQPVYVTQMDSAGASIIMRMDGTQEQVSTSSLKNVEDTSVQEVIESIYAQEAPAIEQGLNEISEEGDMAEAEAAGVEYRPSSEVQRAFDEQEGREAPASGFQSGEVVSVDGKEGEIVSVDPYTRTARVEIDGVPTRVSFDQISRVGQESEVAEEPDAPEVAEGIKSSEVPETQKRQYKVGEIITIREPRIQNGVPVEGDYIDVEVTGVEANADGGYYITLRGQNGHIYGFNTAYSQPTIKGEETQVQTPVAEEVTTSIAEEAATPVAIQPITNEAGELDIRAMGEEQTTQYVAESGDTDYVESMLADRRKKLEKLQKNNKLPLNLAERQKAIAERNAEKARLEEEISMWEGVQNRLSQPQQSAEIESVATPEVAHKVKGVDKQGNPIDEDGNILVDVVESVDDITDEDFDSPTRSIQLPTLPNNVDEAIGANGKPVIIKKNIFERNAVSHSDLTPEQSRQILKSALYSPKLYGQNQKKRKPYNWVVISVQDESAPNKLVLLEVNEGKDNVEIVHWHYIDQRGLEKLKRQAEREDGQLLILPSETSEEVGALADPTLNQPSENKNTTSVPENQTNGQENVSTATANPHTQDQVEAIPFEVGVVMNDAARAMKPKSLDWLNKVAQALGVRIAFVDDVEGGLANGLYNRNTEKPTIYIAANRTAGEKFVIGHEMLHRMAQVAPDAYKAYKEFVLKELGKEEVNARVEKLINQYSNADLPLPSEEELTEEVVADFTGDIISAKGQVFEGFAKKIARKDTKLLRAFRNAVEHIRSFFKKGDAWEQNLTRRLKEFDKLLAESVKAVEQGSAPSTENEGQAAPSLRESAEVGKVAQKIDTAIAPTQAEIEVAEAIPNKVGAEAMFSLRIADALEERSRIYFSRYYGGKNASAQYRPVARAIDEEALKVCNDAISAMVEIMAPHLDDVVFGKRLLPEEVYGKGYTTIFKNGSYGRSMENTTNCVRTLAYNEFTDEVKKQIGRPLTTAESFLASQMLYDIAKDPQCLYCYVSLDRKAYDEFLLRYMQERDVMLKQYAEMEDKSPEAMEALYNTYLNGRKDTKPMRERFNKLISIVDNGGTLISGYELMTREKRNEMRETSEDMRWQIEDAEKYAQDASWAKKEEEYRAYAGEILKMPFSVVRQLSEEYGLRFYSFSEYTPAFIVENMQMVRDAALRGLRGFAYTKEVDFVKIFAPTGMNMNVSTFGRVDSEGNVVPDERQGASWDEVKALREQYPNVGATFVATDDKMVEWALAQDWIDVVIPFHIVRTGADVAEFYKWTNYSSQQSDIKDGRKADIMPTEHHNDLEIYLALCDERGITPRFNQWRENPNYMKLVNETRRSVDETPVLQPTFNLEAAKESWNNFVEKGGYYGGWYEVDEQGFNEAVEQVASDIEAGKSAKDVDYGRQDIPTDYAERARQARVNRAHGNTPSLYSLREMDAPYLEAVERGDMDTAQRMVMEAAKIAMPNTKVVDEDGNPKVVYHQTNASVYINRETGQNWDELDWRERMEWDERDDWDDYWEEREFNTFSRVNARTTNEFDGFFFAPEYDEYHEYGDRTIAAFVNIENPASREDYNIDSSKNNAGREERIRLQNEGYDGVIREYDGVVYEYIAFEPNQIKSADPVTYDDNGNVIPLSERFNPRKEDIRFSLMGERGAANLDAAEEVTTRLDNLNVAREMESAGKDAKTIKLATGWERGADGKWRYEIDDLKLVNPEEWVNKKGRLTLKDIVANAEELFAAYPELRDIKIKKSAAVNNNGAYNHAENTITLSVGVLRRGLEIQSNIERFDTTRENIDKLIDKVINVEVRGTILHEIQHAIQHIEGFARGGNSKMIDASLDRAKTLAVEQEMINQINEKVRQYNSMPVEERRTPSGARLRVQIEEGKRRYAKFKKSIQLGDAGYRKLAGEVESRNVEKRLGMTPEERRNTLLAETEDVAREDQIFILYGMEMAEKQQRRDINESANQELDYRFSIRETDPEILEQLNNGETIKAYRAMQVIDGKLYPPMSAKVEGKLREPIELGVWERAEERPDLADSKGYFKLDKGNKSSVPARYNPYIHTSLTPLNDQFSSAQDRPNLVTVEVEVPVSELTSGYKAEKAKDSVGKVEWKAGVVQSKLSGTRTVILSRWDKPIRIVPDSEVAQSIVEMFDGKQITMPSNVVTPSLRAELEKLGVPFRETNNQGRPLFSLRLPQYTDAFAALKEEYSALDKNDAKALADFRARKRNLVEEYWNDFANALGADVQTMVIDSTNNPEALRPLYDIAKGMAKTEATFEEFIDEYREEYGYAFFITGTNIIFVDMAGYDGFNTQKMVTQTFLHENVHRIIENNIPKRDLVRVWRECAGTDAGRDLRMSYPNDGSATLGEEMLAYSISGLSYTSIKPLLNYIEGEGDVSVEDIMAIENKALPLRNEIASRILTIIKDEYDKKEELGNAVDEETLQGFRGGYDGRDEQTTGNGERASQEIEDAQGAPYGLRSGYTRRGNGRRRDGGYSAGESYSAEGRRIIATGDGFTLEEVEMPEFDESPVYSLRDPIEQIRKEGLTRTGRKLDDVNKEDLPAIAEQYGKESVGRKVERAVFNHLVDVERLQENLYAAGVEKADDNDFINAFEAVRNVVAAKMPNDFNNYIQPLLDIITNLSEKKYGFSYTDVSDYLAAKHSLEREDVSDISTMSTEEGAAWTREKCEQIVSEFESKVPAEIQEELWDAVRAIEKRTLDILLDAGVYTEADIEAIQSHGWEYYVPLQGWDAATENLIEADKIYETPKRGGSTGGKWQEHSAKGRRTKPYDPISTIVSKMNKALYVAETNKALLKLYNLISDGTKVLGKEEASMQFKVSEAYYRNTPEGYVEIDPDDVSQEELKANRELHSELKKLYAERKKIGKYKNVQRWRRYNYELKRANEAGDVERSNKIQERLDSLRQTKGVQLLFEVDAKIDDVKSQLTIFIKAGDMAIPREVNPSNELTRARRVYFYLNGRRMFVQFTNPKYSSAINGRTIVQRSEFDNWVGGLTGWLARSYTTYNPEFAFVTNPIRDFRDAMNWHLLDVDNGNMGGFVNHYVFHWNSTRNAIYRAQRGNANPLTSEELKDFNILNKDDRRAIARIYGRDRLLDTLFEWFAENGGVISYKKAFKTPEAAKNFFGQPQKFKASDFNGHANVYKALQDSAEIITRYATFLASLDKGQSVGQAVANGRNVSVNFNRKGELSTRLGAYYQFFNASAQGIYKYIKLARKRPGRFFGLCMYHAVMGYVSSLLIDWLFTSLFPDNDDDELTNVEIPLWERLGYTVFPIARENGKVHTIRIPKSQNMAGFSAIGVLINEMIKGRIAPKEATEAGLNQLAAAWTYGFSEGAPLIRSIIPSGVPQLAFDLWNNTDAFGREIYRTDKYNTRLPAVEFGKKNVIPWVYDVCSAINKAAGGNEYRSSGKLTDINPSAAQYLMEQLSGGYGVLARKGLEFATSAFYDEVEFEAQNLPALGRVMYTVEPKSWYPEYSTIQNGFDSAAFKNARSELNAGYITQEEYDDIAKRAATYNGFNKHISALRQLRDDFPSNSGAYRDINREVNRKMGLVTKIFEETDWNAPKYWESIDGVIEKYDPYWRESIDNLFKEYGKKE